MAAEWTALPEEEQVARLGRLAASALEAWSLGGARVAPIKYRENAVFAVTSDDGARRVMRVHRPGYRSDAEIHSEAAWTRALSDDGVAATPDFLATTAGDLLAVVGHPDVPEPRQCDLLSWVPGSALGSLEGGVSLAEDALREHYRTVGGIAARLDSHGTAWPKPAGFARPRWDAETLVGDAPTFGPFWTLPELEEAQRTTLLRARDRARRELAALGPPDTLVHGDLIPDNLLSDATGLRIIDFDDCGWSWPLFELATSVFPLLVAGGFDAALRGYLEGYRSVRPFPEDALDRLPAVLMARGLSYLGWPGGRPEIHSQRPLVPYMAKGLTELAEHYLAGTAR